MAPSSLTYVLCIFIIFHIQSTRCQRDCNILSCGDIDIQFPFGLKGSNQDLRCSYFPNLSFQLSCNSRTQLILTLPYSKPLVVKNINYETQSIQVNDPNGCLPKRFLRDWNISGSPFKLNPAVYDNPYNLTFYRCPANVTASSQLPQPLTPILCLSNNNDSSNGNVNSSVIVSWSPPIVSSPMSQRCEVISWAEVPIPMMEMPMWPFWPDLTSDVELAWVKPRCRDCALRGQACGFSENKKNPLQVGCVPSSSSKGLSRSAKYGLIIGAGIPGLLCLIGLSCFICGKVRMMTTHRHHPRGIEFPATISLEPIPFVMGLDGATIEKYPKTLLGDSGRLLKANDSTCAICLSEYEPKETLRSIPECNHYFHADCIDEWLKMNGTCPICRNSPETTLSTVTSSLSSVSHTSSSSSAP